MSKLIKNISVPILRNDGLFCFSINEIKNTNEDDILQQVVGTFQIPDGVEFHSAPLLSKGTYSNGQWFIGDLLPEEEIGESQFCWKVTDDSKAPFEFDLTINHIGGCSSCHKICIKVQGLQCSEIKECLGIFVSEVTSDDNTLTVTMTEDDFGQSYDVSDKYRITEITNDYNLTSEFNYIRVNAENNNVEITASNNVVAGFSWIIKVVLLNFGNVVKLKVNSPNSIDGQLFYDLVNEKAGIELIHIGNGIFDLR